MKSVAMYDDIRITDSGDFQKEHWLHSAVYLSLFTDARDGERGHWADVFYPESIGSFLWKLDRENITNEVIDSVESYARASLKWLLNDSRVKSFTVQAERCDPEQIRLAVEVTERTKETFEYVV